MRFLKYEYFLNEEDSTKVREMYFETSDEFYNALDADEIVITDDKDEVNYIIDFEKEVPVGEEISKHVAIVYLPEDELDDIIKIIEDDKEDTMDVIMEHLSKISSIIALVEETDMLVYGIDSEEDVMDRVNYIYDEFIKEIEDNEDYELGDFDIDIEESVNEEEKFDKKFIRNQVKDAKKKRKKRMSSADRKKMTRAMKKAKRKKRSKPKHERLSLKKLMDEKGIAKNQKEFEENFPNSRRGGVKLAKTVIKLMRNDIELAETKLKRGFAQSLNSLGEEGKKMKEKKGRKLTSKEKWKIKQKNKRNPKHYKSNPYYYAVRWLQKNKSKIKDKKKEKEQE